MLTAGYSSVPVIRETDCTSVISIILTVILPTIAGILLYKKLINPKKYDDLPE